MLFQRMTTHHKIINIAKNFIPKKTGKSFCYDALVNRWSILDFKRVKHGNVKTAAGLKRREWGCVPCASVSANTMTEHPAW